MPRNGRAAGAFGDKRRPRAIPAAATPGCRDVSVWCTQHGMQVVTRDGTELTHERHGDPCGSLSFTVRRETAATPGEALSLLRMAWAGGRHA